MSYAKAAAAAQAYAATLRRADAERRTLRTAEALAKFATALAEMRDRSQAEEAVEHVAEEAARDRLGGVSLADLAPAIDELRDFAEAFGARKSVMDALETLQEIGEAYPILDAGAVALGLARVAAAQAAERSAEAEQKRERREASIALGARYAERLRKAPQTDEALSAIVEEMDSLTPKLPPLAWKEAARQWTGAEEHAVKSVKAARSVIEKKIAAVEDRRPVSRLYARAASA